MDFVAEAEERDPLCTSSRMVKAERVKGRKGKRVKGKGERVKG
jgi:hypothetical protein